MEFIFHQDHFLHILAGLILLSRIGDVVSTLLATPKLVLEANPLVRRFRRPVFILGFLAALLPYYDYRLGLIVLVPSLLVTAQNLSRGWVASSLGETEMFALFKNAARRTTRKKAIAFTLSSAATTALAGLVLLALSGGGDTPALWFAVGILSYALAMAVHGSFFVFRVFREVKA